jgi:hypothetical protein
MLIMFGRLVSTAHIVRLRNRWNVSLDDRPVAAFSIAANVSAPRLETAKSLPSIRKDPSIPMLPGCLRGGFLG